MGADNLLQKLDRKKIRRKRRVENPSLDSQNDEAQNTSGQNKRSKKLRNKRMKNGKISTSEVHGLDATHSNDNEPGGDKFAKLRKKKRVKRANAVAEKINLEEDASGQQYGKSKGGVKVKKNRLLANESSHDNLLEQGGGYEDEVYKMSSGDEDCSKGMRKWMAQYHQSRPGLKVLQERIDDFIVAHEAQQEQARAEREAEAAEGGWTVVKHHKGRKKTTDSESGIAVGSAAQAAILDKMSKKKTKDVGLDFYRFQKKEAHRNEIMMLQSKFEQDKQRIQQMRLARKFRPY